MFKRLSFYCVVLTSMLMVILSACSGGSARPDDAVGLSNDVPVQPTAASQVATPPPVEPTVQTPPEESPLPTATTEISEDNLQSQTNDGPVLIFSLFGGIIGFCDELIINRNGEFTLQICGQDDIVGNLEEGDQVSLQTWYDNLASFNLTFEDNPGGPDNMVTNLSFNGQGQVEADERQQQVIVEWVSGLAIRLRPQQAEEVPTPEPVAVGPEGLCPEITRPALITINFEESPNTLVLIDPNSQATCDIVLSQPPTGRIAAAAGNIYYPIFDLEAKATIVWQLDSNGQENPLTFTSVPMEEPGPFDFVISDDGSKIAWAQTVVDFDVEPPLYRNNLWAVNIDGTNQIAIVDQVENSELRFVSPIRFSANGEMLYYTLQPDIGGPIYSGRFDTVYSVSTTGGQSQLLYACPEENPVCVGGLSPNGDTLTVVQPNEGSIQILNSDGGVINSLPLPAVDYVERTAFGPNGNLAFISATLSQSSEDAPPLPNPGYINFIAPPYTGESQLLLSNNNIGTLRGWLDDNRLVFGSLDAEGNLGTSIVTIEGQVTDLLPNVAVGVIR